MKIYKFFIISVSLLLIGCTQIKKDEINMDSDKNNISTETGTISSELLFYSDEQLTEIADFAGTESELLARYPTTYIRTLPIKYSESGVVNDQYAVRLIYRAETKALSMVFDTSGNKLFTRVYDTSLSKQAFDSLSLGHTLADVRAIDPRGEYLFLYTGRNDFPRVSSHYTTDGFIVSITYDKSNVIEKIDIAPM